MQARAVTLLMHGHNCHRGGMNLLTGVIRRGREEKVDIRRVHIAGEQLLCRGRAVCYQRKEEPEREKNSIFLDKVATISVCFKPLSNWRGRELYLRL